MAAWGKKTWGEEAWGEEAWGEEEACDEDDSPDLLYEALSEAVSPLADLEPDPRELRQLEKRLNRHFRASARSLRFNAKPWSKLVDEYADCVFSSLFQVINDKRYLWQADLLLVMDAGVRELFPPHLLARVPQQVFQRTLLLAHDRAFEENRQAPLLWDTVCVIVLEPEARSKTYDAFDAGRKEALTSFSWIASVAADESESSDLIEVFLDRWINKSIERLSAACAAAPEVALSPEAALCLMCALLEAGALPLPVVAELGEHPPPLPGRSFLDDVVKSAYASYSPHFAEGSGGCDASGPGTSAKRRKVGTAEARQVNKSSKGNPGCAQKEDCIGTPSTGLVQHMDGDVGGDIYCTACWAVLAEGDMSLTAVPVQKSLDYADY